MSSIQQPRTACGLRFLAATFSTLLFIPEVSAALPPNLIRQVESAAQDLTRGRAADAHQKLQPLLEQSQPAQLKEVEDLLQKAKVPGALGPKIADLRIDVTMAAGSKPVKTLRPMGPIEAGFVKAVVDAKIKAMLVPVDKELDIGFRVDAPIEALEEQLVRCSSLLDQMETVERLQALLADAGKQAKDKIAKGDKKKNTAKKDVADNKTRGEQLAVRVVEICLVLIPDQLQVLRDDGAKYEDRAKAAARLEDAFAVAKQNFNRYRGAKKNKGKSVGGKTVAEHDAALKDQDREFDKLAGPLRLKIYHYEQGKQWWLRGRWGVGPYHDGLTKAAFSKAPLDALLFYPLLMPDPIPKPIDPLKDARPLPISRRHLDVWKAALPVGQAYARAERNFAISNQLWKLALQPPGQGNVNLLKAIDSDEDFNPFVGYLEYQMALFHWGRLLSLASEAELAGLEKSLAADDRFVVHSYLSRQYDNVDPKSTLKLSPPKSDDPRAADVYERRGLSWCIAMAQIEVAGVRAVYSGLECEPRAIPDYVPDEKITRQFGWPSNRTRPGVPARAPRTVRPFDGVNSTPFTQRAFAELLWDGMRQHYYRTQAEVVIDDKQIINIWGMDPYLAAAIRLAVASEFIEAYQRKFGKTLTAVQMEELRRWDVAIEQKLSRLIGAWADRLRRLATEIGWRNQFVPGNQGNQKPPTGNQKQPTGNQKPPDKDAKSKGDPKSGAGKTGAGS